MDGASCGDIPASTSPFTVNVIIVRAVSEPCRRWAVAAMINHQDCVFTTWSSESGEFSVAVYYEACKCTLCAGGTSLHNMHQLCQKRSRSGPTPYRPRAILSPVRLEFRGSVWLTRPNGRNSIFAEVRTGLDQSAGHCVRGMFEVVPVVVTDVMNSKN